MFLIVWMFRLAPLPPLGFICVEDSRHSIEFVIAAAELLGCSCQFVVLVTVLPMKEAIRHQSLKCPQTKALLYRYFSAEQHNTLLLHT
ncbi:hypothetical protein [Marinomonas sp. THO17]|uniref:hypothetical protein n=1 Tax=Marinomonas sp. THO17 TaxID=3149048 RepID=UPI00336C12AB